MLSVDASPEQCLNYIDDALKRGVKDYKHPFHQFVLSTFEDTQIEQRMLVLRRWVLNRRTIIFHTDYRSPKISQLKKNRQCSILFYSKSDNIQLRIKGSVHIHQHDDLANVFFNEATPNQLKHYEGSIPPSTKIDLESLENNGDSNTNPKEHFCVCVCNFNDLELLYLNKKKNIRILYEWDKNSRLTYNYLAP